MWTDGSVHEMAPGAPLVTDPELIAFERARAAEAEAQDAAGEGSAEARFCCALRIDFLVALTFELNLWHWPTRDVRLKTSPILVLNSSLSLWRKGGEASRQALHRVRGPLPLRMPPCRSRLLGQGRRDDEPLLGRQLGHSHRLRGSGLKYGEIHLDLRSRQQVCTLFVLWIT